MIIDHIIRTNIKTNLKLDKLPKVYFHWYVAYTWNSDSPKFTFGPYIIGFDCIHKAYDFKDQIIESGREAHVINEYPFELGLIK